MVKTLIFLFFPILLFARLSSYPFISGDTFRNHCNYTFEDTGSTVIPDKVKYGDAIFVRTNFLKDFVKKVHPLIANPYILVTHNHINSSPGEFANLLDDPKIIAWFAKNVDRVHPKLYPLPLGLANRNWPHGDIGIVASVQQTVIPKTIGLYMNFSVYNNKSVRTPVYDLFKTKSYCTISGRKNYRDYLIDLAQSKFVISPPGIGIDCYRTWEALYVGSYPIVLTSTIDALFEGLPVVIVKNWEEVTPEFLDKKWKELNQGTYHFERIYADFWLKQIDAKKIEK